jgi:hypothetical protein
LIRINLRRHNGKENEPVNIIDAGIALWGSVPACRVRRPKEICGAGGSAHPPAAAGSGSGARLPALTADARSAPLTIVATGARALYSAVFSALSR